MTAEELRIKLSNESIVNKKWPDHLEVDADTYANACQAIFDWAVEQDGVDVSKDFTLKRQTISFGINNGIMFKNVELILTHSQESELQTFGYLNMDELRVIYNLLLHEYISYENIDAINLIHKIRSLIGE